MHVSAAWRVLGGTGIWYMPVFYSYSIEQCLAPGERQHKLAMEGNEDVNVKFSEISKLYREIRVVQCRTDLPIFDLNILRIFPSAEAQPMGLQV